MKFLFVFISTLFGPQAHAGWLFDLCQRHMIIAEDPYQFETLSVLELVETKAYHLEYGIESSVLENEMKKRLLENITILERVLLTSALEAK